MPSARSPRTTGKPRPVRRPKAPRTLADLKPAEYNPRRISDAALAGLKTSLDRFGDLSGIVWNARTGRLVAGHQRLRSLRELHGDSLSIDREGIEPALVAPSGARFPIRVVDWDEPTEKAANVAANNPHIAGEFDDERLDGLLLELRELDPDFHALRFDALSPGEAPTDTAAASSRSEAPSGEPALGPAKPAVLIECDSEREQFELLARFEAEGMRCRALTL